MIDKIKFYTKGKNIYSNVEAADIIEYQDYQERQAKFINNAIRVYEFWGYEWRTPFWDKNILEYWSWIPLSWRYGRRLYFEFDKKYCLNYINNFRTSKYKVEYVYPKYDKKYFIVANIKTRLKQFSLVNEILRFK